jgi:hypothetical protein
MTTFAPPNRVHEFLHTQYPHGFYAAGEGRIDVARLQPATLKALLADPSVDAPTKALLENMLAAADESGGDDFVASAKRAAAKAAKPAGQPVLASFAAADDESFVASCARAASR